MGSEFILQKLDGTYDILDDQGDLIYGYTCLSESELREALGEFDPFETLWVETDASPTGVAFETKFGKLVEML